MTEIGKALITYEQAQTDAAKLYEQAWVEQFAKLGLNFGPPVDHWGSKTATLGPLTITMWTYPRRFAGVKLKVGFAAQFSQVGLVFTGVNRNFKCVAESGAIKFRRKLDKIIATNTL